MKLIDKDAVVAEIERRIESCAKQREDMLNVQCHALADDASARMGELKCIQDFLDTLEVKEVDSLQEESVSEELEKVVEEIVDPTVLNAYGAKDIANRLRRTMIESVSEEWIDVAKQYVKEHVIGIDKFTFSIATDMFISGAKLQKENLWKPADGDNLPEIDREVVVLIKYDAQRNIHDEEYPTYRVGFGHRPNPNGWDGKNIDTNEVTHYTPKLYDKGGWNAPDIVYWLDYDINELLCR